MKKCAFCSKEFTTICRKQKYCSRKCCEIYGHRKKRNLPLYPILVKKCFFCSREFTPLYVDKKYCSKKCASLFFYRKSNNIDLNLPINYHIKRFYIDHKGYKKIYKPSHPNSSKSGYIPEHRLVMSEALGRTLRKDETIHHINGDRLDNRLENLELRDGAHGSGQRVIDKIQHCFSYLEKHGYLESLFKAWKNKELKLNRKDTAGDSNEELYKQYVLPIVQGLNQAPQA